MDRDPRQAAIRRTIIAILILNLAVAAAKAIYGWTSGALAVSSDAIHSLLDAISNVVGIVALHAAARPPDRDHPYGHAKIESAAAATIGLSVGVAAARFGWVAIRGLLEGLEPPPVSDAGIAALAATLAINTFVAAYEARRGRALDSPFLVADAAHTGSDVLVTIAVIASQLATRFGVWWADPAAAIAVLLVIARVAWQLLRQNLATLIDHAAVDADRVRELVTALPGVRGVHRIRSSGLAGAARIDLHLKVDGAQSLRGAHAISHRVEEEIRRTFRDIVDVTIHVEPDDDPDEGL